MTATRAALRFLCILLLLAAQQGALTHAVWHLKDYLPAQGHHDLVATKHQHEDTGQSSEPRLCGLHAVLGSLLAGDCAGQPVVALPDLSYEFVASPDTGRAARFTATSLSRAPPVLL
jgi:hypothetical protein